jgi:dTDP-4-amino-4,6-dideoxygalactose transaminase
MGEKHGRKSGSLAQTQLLSERLVRLPLWLGLEEFQSEVILEVIAEL